MKIALTGNPNSGKTTLFNAITGKLEYVGNWAGVTVDKKEASVKLSLYMDECNRENRRDQKLTQEGYNGHGHGHGRGNGIGKQRGHKHCRRNILNNLSVVDLPGAYSISPYTSEETITKDFIQDENPDVIINIVDATNISRSLFFTTQLLELGIPVVVALNKSDLTKKKGNYINTGVLSRYLNCPVVETSATKLSGLRQLISECIRHIENPHPQKPPRIDGLKNAKNERQHKIADKKRFAFVKEVVSQVERRKIDSSAQTIQDKIDRIVASRLLGIPIFAAVIFFIFWVSQAWLGPIIADLFVGVLEIFQGWVAGLIEGVEPIVSALLIDGIIGGVIAIVGFLPLIMVMFFLMALLEDCGYMARVAVIMDKYFKKIGLSGRSIIPMVIGTGCGIPGVMASRTIKNERQRRTTAMLTPFMPCGAKLPIIALFAGVFFKGNAWVGTTMYFLAILVIVFSALIIRKITGDNTSSYFIMELPEYRIPSLGRAAVSMMSRGKSFIIKAGTVILVCNAIIHIMQSFDWNFNVTDVASESILASIASPFAVLLIPLGFGLWQFAAAAITGFIAKENVVGTLAVCFGISNFINTESLEIVSGSGATVGVEAAFGIGAVAGLSYLVFNLFTPPCFACIGAIRAEVNSAKWTWGAVGFQLAMGYVLAFLVYQLGTLITTGSFGNGFIYGLIAVVAICGYIGYLMKKGSSDQRLASQGQTA